MMRRLISVLILVPLSGCSPANHAIVVTEPMTWHALKGRSLIELRYVHDPRYFVTVCSPGLLDHLERLGKREISVEHRVWGKWPWSRELYGFNPEWVEGRQILHRDERGQVSGFRGSDSGRHPLERHLRR